MLVEAQWSNPLDDDRISQVANHVFTQIDEQAHQRNLTHRWIYLNYAGAFQDPIASYGSENKAKLQAVSKKYDPEGWFQKGVPGGYKLFTSPK